MRCFAVRGKTRDFHGPLALHFRARDTSLINLIDLASPKTVNTLSQIRSFSMRTWPLIAVRLLRPLADQGNADAQMKLGFMYVAGEGIPQDYVEALKWFRLAADQRQANAQCFLGLMYFEGRGVLRDYVSAHMWLDLAAAGGIEDAAEYRHALTAKMTSAQVAEAQRLAREWKPWPKIAKFHFD
jgi:TPR repeat protein